LGGVAAHPLNGPLLPLRDGACVAVRASDLRDKSRNAHGRCISRLDLHIGRADRWVVVPEHRPKHQTIGSADLGPTSDAQMYSFQQLLTLAHSAATVLTLAHTSGGGHEAGAPPLNAPLINHRPRRRSRPQRANGARYRVDVFHVDGGCHRPWRPAADAGSAGENNKSTSRVAHFAGQALIASPAPEPRLQLNIRVRESRTSCYGCFFSCEVSIHMPCDRATR